MTLRGKLYAGFGVMLLLLLAQSLFSGYLFRESRDLGESVNRQQLPQVMEVITLRELLYQAQSSLNGWVLSGQQPFQQQYRRYWEGIEARLERVGDDVLKGRVVQLRQLQDEVMALAHTLESLPASRLMQQGLMPHIEEIQEAAQRLTFLEERRGQGEKDPMQIRRSNARIHLLSTLQRSFSESVAVLNTVLLDGDPLAQARFTRLWRENEEVWTALNGVNLNQQQLESLERIRAVRDLFLRDAAEIIKIRTGEKWDLAAWRVSHEVLPAVEQVIASVSKLIEERTRQLNEGFVYQSEMMGDGTRLVWLFLLVALVVTALTARAVVEGVRRPIQKVEQVFKDIHDKIYHTPIEVESNDEMGALLEALKGMREQLLAAEVEEQETKSVLQNHKFALDQAAIVSATGLDGRINYVNQRMLDITGYREEELLGRSHRLFKSDVHDDAFFEHLWKTISAGLVWRGEICNQTCTGRKIWLDTTIVPFLGEDLLPFQYMAIRHDITLIKESEQRIREEQARTIEANSELQRSMLQLQEAQHQLVESEKMASLGGLVAGVAHEVNTPLGISVTAASFLKDQSDQISGLYEKQQMKRSDLEQYMKRASESSGIVLENLRRASALIKSFKQVAVDQSSSEERPFLLVEYMHDILRSLQPKLKRLSHKIVIEGDEELEVVSDPGAFAQVITNLVMNAVIHGLDDDKSGTITMEVEEQGGEVTLIFADDGKGAPADVVEHIFEPFFTTRRGSGGSGLGLHLVYNLVIQRLGGEIQCQSTVGEGMHFTIRFPQKRQDSIEQ